MRLPPFSLERFFARHEFSARHLLCASDCESMSVDELFALEPGAAEAFGALRLGYTESPGSPSLRAAIARLYDGTRPEDILVTNGAEEAIFIFMHAALASEQFLGRRQRDERRQVVLDPVVDLGEEDLFFGKGHLKLPLAAHQRFDIILQLVLGCPARGRSS